jgi:hypothetical protein
MFSKYYPRDVWRARYTGADLPVNNLTIAVLQDIRTGLQPKVASKTESKKKN